MDTRLDQLLKREEMLFSHRAPLVSLWQDIADNFYPERGDFTISRGLGDEFAVGLMTSFPVVARRDLGNAFGAMLRPPNKHWFEMTTNTEDDLNHEARSWLQWASGVQRRAMNDRDSQFSRASKEGDHDFAAFGQCVISVELNKQGDKLLYRNWHLRDCAWAEGYDGKVDTVFRRWKPAARNLLAMFPKKFSQAFKDKCDLEPFREVDCRHVILPSSQFDTKIKKPYVSIYYELEEGTILEEVGCNFMKYVVPRWQTVSGSQYAYSPATITALPDARLIQTMTRVLLEAGEKAVDPPMIAVTDAIKSDIAIYAGGITWVDESYDERLGEVLRPITQDRSGLPRGLDMADRTASMITECFYLNKLTLPPPTKEMTAYEAGQRVTEYIRQALPIFEPMEYDYNGALCEATFQQMFDAGGFGPMDSIPDQLLGADIRFKFQSPLHAAIDEQKSNKLLQAKQMLATVVDLDPDVTAIVQAEVALRDALSGIGVPMRWVRGEREATEIRQVREQQRNAQMALAQAQQGADAAHKLGQASKQFAEGERAAA